MEKFKVSQSLLDQNMDDLKEGYSLHDYCEVVKHLLNEIIELKKEVKLLNSQFPRRFK